MDSIKSIALLFFRNKCKFVTLTWAELIMKIFSNVLTLLAVTYFTYKPADMFYIDNIFCLLLVCDAMVSCVLFWLIMLLIISSWQRNCERAEMQRCFKMASVPAREGNHAGQNSSANTRNPHWHAMQCLICFRTKCKLVQVFRLSDQPQEKRGEGDGKQQCAVDKNGRGKGFYRRHEDKSLWPWSGLGISPNDKCVFV